MDKIETAGDRAFLEFFQLVPDKPKPYKQRHYPRQPRPVIRHMDDGLRELIEMSWGLVPHWVKDLRTAGRHTYNARDDSLAANKPMFREAFRYRRCLLPATSYFERPTINGKVIDYELKIDGGAPYACAGLWEYREDEVGLTCTMVTTEPNSFVSYYQDRMPVILRPEDYATWLDPETPRDVLLSLLLPIEDERMSAFETDELRRKTSPTSQALLEI